MVEYWASAAGASSSSGTIAPSLTDPYTSVASNSDEAQDSAPDFRLAFDAEVDEAFEVTANDAEDETFAQEWWPDEPIAGSQEAARPNEGLMNAADFAIASNKRKLETSKEKKEAKRILTTATELLAHQLELRQVQPQLDEVPVQPDEVEFVQSEGERAHLSHTMKKMHGSEQVVYCSVCSYWQKTKKVTAALLAPCEDIKRSNWSKLRLLQCGVMPGPGARLPAGMARAKGTAKKPTGTTGRRSTLASPIV